MTQTRWWMSVAAVLALSGAAPAQYFRGCEMPGAGRLCDPNVADLNGLGLAARAVMHGGRTATEACAEACVEAVRVKTWASDVCALGGKCCDRPAAPCCCVKPAVIGCVCGGTAGVTCAGGCCPNCCKVRKDADKDENEPNDPQAEPCGECPLLMLLDLLGDVLDALWPCQTWAAGQTLPAPVYLEHPPQYFAPSPVCAVPMTSAAGTPPYAMPVAGVMAPPPVAMPTVPVGVPMTPAVWGGPPVYPPNNPYQYLVPPQNNPYQYLVPPIPPAPPVVEVIPAPAPQMTTIHFVQHDGKGHLEIEAEASKAVCMHMSLKVGGKTVQLAAGKTHVLVSAGDMKGHADKVVSDHCGKIILEGHVQVRSEKDGQTSLIKAERVVVDLSNGQIRCQVKGL